MYIDIFDVIIGISNGICTILFIPPPHDRQRRKNNGYHSVVSYSESRQEPRPFTMRDILYITYHTSLRQHTYS